MTDVHQCSNVDFPFVPLCFQNTLVIFGLLAGSQASALEASPYLERVRLVGDPVDSDHGAPFLGRSLDRAGPRQGPG